MHVFDFYSFDFSYLTDSAMRTPYTKYVGDYDTLDTFRFFTFIMNSLGRGKQKTTFIEFYAIANDIAEML